MLTQGGFLTDQAAYWLAILVYLAATVLSVILSWPTWNTFRGIATEKNDTSLAPGASAPTSFSRVTGLIGTIYLTAFCWGLGLYLLTKVWVDPGKLKEVVPDGSKFILAGASLFTPYAFNQVSHILGNRQPPSLPPPPPRLDTEG